MAVDWDVVVVGAGNAALCAAISAAEAGAKVLVLERAPAAPAHEKITYERMRIGDHLVEATDNLYPLITQYRNPVRQRHQRIQVVRHHDDG